MKKLGLIFLCILLLVACQSNVAKKEETIEEIIEIENIYDKVMTLDLKETGAIYRANESGLVGVINEHGEIIIPIEYDDVYQSHEGGVIAQVGTNYDYYLNGEKVIAFEEVLKQLEQKYDSFQVDKNLGVFLVEKNGKYTYVDLNGNQITEDFYDLVQPISLGMEEIASYVKDVFIIANKEGKNYFIGLVRLDGTVIAEPKHKNDSYTEYGHLEVSFYEMYAMTIGNMEQNELSIELLFYNVANKFILKDGDSYSGYTYQGEVLFEEVDAAYRSYSNSEENYIIVKKDNQYGIIFSDNSFSGFIYDNYSSEYLGDLQIIFSKNGKYGCLNSDGTIVLDFKYDFIKLIFSEEGAYYSVGLDGKKYVVDQEENILFSHNENELYKIGDYYNTSSNTVLDSKGNIVLEGIQLDSEYDRGYTGYSEADDFRSSYLLDKNLTIVQEFSGLYWVRAICGLYSGEEYRCSSNYLFYYEDGVGNGILSKDGTIVMKDANYSSILYRYGIELLLYPDKIVVQNGEKELIVDSLEEKKEFKATFAEVQSVPGFFLVSNEQLGFYNKNLDLMFEVNADWISPYPVELELEDGTTFKIYYIQRNQRYGLMLETGEILLEPIYDGIIGFTDIGYGLVLQDGMGAVVSYKGEFITDFIYSLPQGYDYNSDFIGEWYRVGAHLGTKGYYREREVIFYRNEN